MNETLINELLVKDLQLNEYEAAPDFFSIKPKNDKWLLVYFVFSPLFCAKNCSEHENKIIFGEKQVNSGNNAITKVNKQ